MGLGREPGLSVREVARPVEQRPRQQVHDSPLPVARRVRRGKRILDGVHERVGADQPASREPRIAEQAVEDDAEDGHAAAVGRGHQPARHAEPRIDRRQSVARLRHEVLALAPVAELSIDDDVGRPGAQRGPERQRARARIDVAAAAARPADVEAGRLDEQARRDQRREDLPPGGLRSRHARQRQQAFVGDRLDHEVPLELEGPGPRGIRQAGGGGGGREPPPGARREGREQHGLQNMGRARVARRRAPRFESLYLRPAR